MLTYVESLLYFSKQDLQPIDLLRVASVLSVIYRKPKSAIMNDLTVESLKYKEALEESSTV